MGNLVAVPRKYRQGRKGAEPFTKFEQEWNFWAGCNYSEFGCWNWARGKNHFGYGSVYFNGRVETSNRVAWKITNGVLKKPLQALHKCDNVACIRPDHLFSGTQAENVADMVLKGRRNGPFGEACHSAKLSEKEVRNIRILSNTKTSRWLSEKFNISKSQVNAIIRRSKWKWLK